MARKQATRLDRLVVECSEELHLGADYGMASVSAADVAKALLLADSPLSDDDAAYCQEIADGDRDDDEPA